MEQLCFDDHRQEAEGVVQGLLHFADAEQRPWSDFAIFYRINALSREVERALSRHRIPYQVAAGVAFYERAEIKDLLAYLRLIHNPADRTAFLRVVNTPARGIGKTTSGKLAGWADREGLTLLEAARRGGEFPGLSPRAVVALKRFAGMIDDFAGMSYGAVAEFLEAVLERTHYGAEWRGSDLETDIQRAANVDELRNCGGAIRRRPCRRSDAGRISGGGGAGGRRRRARQQRRRSHADDFARRQGPGVSRRLHHRRRGGPAAARPAPPGTVRAMIRRRAAACCSWGRPVPKSAWSLRARPPHDARQGFSQPPQPVPARNAAFLQPIRRSGACRRTGR